MSIITTSRRRSAAMSCAVAAVLAGATATAAAKQHGVSARGLLKALKADGIKCRRGRPKTSEGRNPIVLQRRNRLHQVAHRGSRRSPKTEAENLGLLLLWEAEVLSEGQVARALNIDRMSLRMMRDVAMAEAMRLAEALLPIRSESE